MKRRRRGAPEINLTSLLDVLFCILFIVMLSGAKNVADYKQETKKATASAKAISEENKKLTRENEELKESVQEYRSSDETVELYNHEAIVLNMRNFIQDGKHVLRVSRVTNSEDIKEIVLSNDNTEQSKRIIKSYIEEIVVGSTNQPIYVVFNIDTTSIYTKEATAIDDVLNDLQNHNKEVFYKRLEEGDNETFE